MGTLLWPPTLMPRNRPIQVRTASGLHLRHDRQGSSLRVMKVRHPLLGSVRVTVNQVGRVRKLDAARAQQLVRRTDVLDAQVKNGFRAGLFLRTQEQPRAPTVEERQ